MFLNKFHVLSVIGRLCFLWALFSCVELEWWRVSLEYQHPGDEDTHGNVSYSVDRQSYFVGETCRNERSLRTPFFCVKCQCGGLKYAKKKVRDLFI